jgi:transcriptional regulator GlxA family with amidase domain
MPTPPQNRRMDIEILFYDGFDDLDVFGPFEVLRGAGIPVKLVTAEPRAHVTSAGGARVVPDGVVGDPDLVMVPGGGWSRRPAAGSWAEARRGVIGELLKARHAAGRPLASVCTGAMLLASAGLLKGRRAITHHDALDDLAAAGADVQHGERFVDDGDIMTAAGVSSGIDFALWLVERELGTEAAEAEAAMIEWKR